MQTEKKELKEQTKAPTPPPSSSNPSSDLVSRKRSSTDAPSVKAILKNQKSIEERLNEEGPGKATLADLQTCVRVGQSGFSLFEEVQKLVAGEMTEHLQGAKVGFEQSVKIAVVLEPSINFEYLDAKYEARDGKIYLGDEVAYDPEAEVEFPNAGNAADEDAPTE